MAAVCKLPEINTGQTRLARSLMAGVFTPADVSNGLKYTGILTDLAGPFQMSAGVNYQKSILGKQLARSLMAGVFTLTEINTGQTGSDSWLASIHYQTC